MPHKRPNKIISSFQGEKMEAKFTRKCSLRALNENVIVFPLKTVKFAFIYIKNNVK